MKFAPWDEPLRSDPCLPIREPPCKSCRWFLPRQLTYFDPTQRRSILESVRICWATTMHPDFSCYEELSAKEEN